MTEVTVFQNRVVTANDVWGAELFELPGEKFLFLRPELTVREEFVTRQLNKVVNAASAQSVEYVGTLVRLPSICESKWRVIVLQRWTGLVEEVGPQSFLAVIKDLTNPQNALEEARVDTSEVSASDLPLLVTGAGFYWSIGYRDSPGGQRERISTLRFSRQSKLSSARVKQAFEKAGHTATLLESD